MEITNVVTGGGIWSPIVNSSSSETINFAKMEDPYGFAVYQWSPVGVAGHRLLHLYHPIADIVIGTHIFDMSEQRRSGRKRRQRRQTEFFTPSELLRDHSRAARAARAEARAEAVDSAYDPLDGLVQLGEVGGEGRVWAGSPALPNFAPTPAERQSFLQLVQRYRDANPVRGGASDLAGASPPQRAGPRVGCACRRGSLTASAMASSATIGTYTSAAGEPSQAALAQSSSPWLSAGSVSRCAQLALGPCGSRWSCQMQHTRQPHSIKICVRRAVASMRAAFASSSASQPQQTAPWSSAAGSPAESSLSSSAALLLLDSSAPGNARPHPARLHSARTARCAWLSRACCAAPGQQAALPDGDYLIRYVVYCDVNVGGRAGAVRATASETVKGKSTARPS